MRTRRWMGASTLILASLALYLAVAAGALAAECTLTVEPEQAVAGSEFHLIGSGFTPTELILQKEGSAPATVELDLGDQDPFEIPIGSRKGDEGVWQATASLPGVCSASVTFTATLEETDAFEGLPAAPAAGRRMPLSLVLAIIIVGVGGGAAVGWRLNRA